MGLDMGDGFCKEDSARKIEPFEGVRGLACGVLLWLGSDRKTILLHTHTHTDHHFTNNISLHTTPLHA
jgi:hypothetical protein